LAKPLEAAVVSIKPAVAPQPELLPFSKPEPDMRFLLVRGSNPLCNPDCPEWISAEGTIVAGTPDRLRQLLDTVGGRRLPLVINSPGGDVQAALAAGRLIRERKLDVAVARTDFLDCDPDAAGCIAKDEFHTGLTVDAGGECDAACAVMIAGGERRLVGGDADLSVHTIGMEHEVQSYLNEMGIGPGFFTAIHLYAVRRQLQPAEMLRFGLTTGRQSVDELTGATICKLSPKPDNCRVLPAGNAEAEAPKKL
jgi:hypothetical protein